MPIAEFRVSSPENMDIRARQPSLPYRDSHYVKLGHHRHCSINLLSFVTQSFALSSRQTKLTRQSLFFHPTSSHSWLSPAYHETLFGFGNQRFGVASYNDKVRGPHGSGCLLRPTNRWSSVMSLPPLSSQDGPKRCCVANLFPDYFFSSQRSLTVYDDHISDAWLFSATSPFPVHPWRPDFPSL